MADYGTDFNVAFQQHALAVLLRTPNAVRRFRTVVRPEFFSTEEHRVVARTLVEQVDSYKTVPTEETLRYAVLKAVPEEKQSQADHMVTRLFKDAVHDGERVLDLLVEFGRTQALVNAILESADDINAGKVDRIRGRVDDALLVGTDLTNLGLRYADESRLSWYTNPPLDSVIPTGLVHVDAAQNGGLGRGELGVILAPPKRGKTTTLINIGYGALRDLDHLNVVHFSLEMKRDKICRRYDDRLMGARVARRSTDPEWYVNALRDRMGKFIHGNLFVFHYPTRTASIDTLRGNLVTLAAQGYHPDVILVDYGAIMKPTRRLGEMRHEVAGIFEELRAMADEFDAVVWSASQANRAATEKELVTMGDFAECFEIAGIADAIWAFCQTPDERIDGVCRLFGTALRDAPDAMTVTCSIDRASCTLRTLELLDAAHTPITVAGDVVEGAVTAEVAPSTRRAVARRGAAVAEAVGIGAPARKKPVTRKKRPVKKRPTKAAATGVKPKKRPMRPSKNLAPMVGSD